MTPLPIRRVAMEAAWAPAAVFVLHVTLGAVIGHEHLVDPASHFFGGVAMAFFVRRSAVICHRLIGSATPLGLDLLAFGLTCAAAVFWELGEFGSDAALGTTTQHGLADTMRDLALGAGGATALLAVGAALRRRA